MNLPDLEDGTGDEPAEAPGAAVANAEAAKAICKHLDRYTLKPYSNGDHNGNGKARDPVKAAILDGWGRYP